jgi:hypothetical protein
MRKRLRKADKDWTAQHRRIRKLEGEKEKLVAERDELRAQRKRTKDRDHKKIRRRDETIKDPARIKEEMAKEVTKKIRGGPTSGYTAEFQETMANLSCFDKFHQRHAQCYPSRDEAFVWGGRWHRRGGP